MKQLKHISNKMKMCLVAVLSFALVGVGFWQFAHAAPNQVYLTPASPSVQNGNNTTVSLRATPGSPVDGVEATITYDQSKLQFVSIDSSASAFNAQLTQSGGGGTVTIIRGSLSGNITVDSLVANITFKALAGSGTTPLTLTANMTSGGSYTVPGVGNAVVTLTSPPSTPPPSGGGGGTTPPPSSGGGGGGTSTPSGGTSKPSGGTSTPSGGSTSTPQAPPAETEVGLKEEQKKVEFNTAIIGVQANKKISVYIAFGTDSSQLSTSTAATGFGTAHDIKMDGQLITPGLTYYYKVMAKDEAGNPSEGQLQSFKTKGYTVKMAVKDADGNPLKKTKLTLHSDPMTGETDESGAITFENVAPGEHELEYEVSGSKKYTEKVTVAALPIAEAADGTQTAEAQNLAVVFAQLKEGDGIPVILPIVLVLVLIAGAGGAFFYIRRRNVGAFAPSSQPAFNPFPKPTNPDAAKTDELVNKVKGVDRPDPGSVVNPKLKQ